MATQQGQSHLVTLNAFLKDNGVAEVTSSTSAGDMLDAFDRAKKKFATRNSISVKLAAEYTDVINARDALTELTAAKA